MANTIKELRQNGYKVRVMHERYLGATAPNGISTIFARGGSTTIELTTPDKAVTVKGTSFCSLEDNFNRKVGNQIALGRALKNLLIIEQSRNQSEV